ncbi:MAG: response regulator transcription factor [Candidatus Muiribacteriota bacterium]
MTIRVFIADDHDIIRDGLKMLIEKKTKNLQICGEADNGKDALSGILKLKPDLVILDVEMPEMTGIEVTRRVIAKKSDAKIILLSMHDKEELVEKSLESGAKGYILKEEASKELIDAIKEVMDGNVYFSPRLAKFVLNLYLDVKNKAKKFEHELTKREREVVGLICQGKTNREISSELGIALNTVNIHRKNSMRKLNIHNTADLIKYAIKEGIFIP